MTISSFRGILFEVEEIAKLSKYGGEIKELDDEYLFTSKRGDSVWRDFK